MNNEPNHGFGKRNSKGGFTVTEDTSVSSSFLAGVDELRQAVERERVSPARWIIRLLLVIVLIESVRNLLG